MPTHPDSGPPERPRPLEDRLRRRRGRARPRTEAARFAAKAGGRGGVMAAARRSGLRGPDRNLDL